MNLDWRLVVFELFNFLVLMLLLTRLLFRPLRRVIAARREELERRDRQLAEREAAAEALQAELRRRLGGLEEEGQVLRLEARARGEAEAEQMVAEARQEAERLRAQMHRDLERAQRRALDDLRQETIGLAVEAAAQVVRGMNGADVGLAYAQEGARRLRQVSPLASEDVVRARHSADLDPARLQGVLEAALGCRVESEQDPALVGGVVLQHGDVEVRANAGDALSTWLEELGDVPAPAEPVSS